MEKADPGGSSDKHPHRGATPATARLWGAGPRPWWTSTTGSPYYTTTACPRCGAEVAGLQGRYACGLCDWVSPADYEAPTSQNQD